MSMTAADLNRRDALLRTLHDAWDHLTSEERSTLENTVNKMATGHFDGLADDGLSSLYQPLTEAQLVERIDRSLAHFSQGMRQDSEIMEAELIAELGL